MKALILAAGYGTRLYPHTKDLPKPLLKISNRPIINYLLDKIDELNNISRIIVVTNSRFYKQFKAWEDTLRIKHRIRLVNDLTTKPQERLGAIGDMHLVFSQEKWSGDFLVLGGDNFFGDSLTDFIHFAKSKSGYVTIGLFDVKHKKEARNFGVVRLDKENRIIQFCEKPSRPNSSLVAMCLYYIPEDKLQSIVEYFEDPSNCRDAAGAYIGWLSSRDKVYGFVFGDFWFDIGHIQTYKKVERVLRREV